MTAADDVRFLALLVHRGYLERGDAESLLTELKAGAPLDGLLEQELGWAPKKVAVLRKTRAGEEPAIPGFQILGRLGVGGTADVFRAREKRTGKVLALKILNPRTTRNAMFLKAFVAEGKLLEKLQHPALVGGFGVAKAGEIFFSKLELVEGKTLLELVDEGQVFDERVALGILLNVAEALAYLDSQNLVHRDVKPGNIMLTQNGEVKLIDLGFCATKDARNANESAVGTVAYLSPEQAQGGALADLRSDIYSLGATLFHLVIGRLPFESSDDHEVLRMQVMESLSSPELKSRGLSPHLHYFIEKMMAKDAEVRYQSWDELLQDIREQIEGRESLDYGRDARARTRRRGPGDHQAPIWRGIRVAIAAAWRIGAADLDVGSEDLQQFCIVRAAGSNHPQPAAAEAVVEGAVNEDNPAIGHLALFPAKSATMIAEKVDEAGTIGVHREEGRCAGGVEPHAVVLPALEQDSAVAHDNGLRIGTHVERKLLDIRAVRIAAVYESRVVAIIFVAVTLRLQPNMPRRRKENPAVRQVTR